MNECASTQRIEHSLCLFESPRERDPVEGRRR